MGRLARRSSASSAAPDAAGGWCGRDAALLRRFNPAMASIHGHAATLEGDGRTFAAIEAQRACGPAQAVRATRASIALSEQTTYASNPRAVKCVSLRQPLPPLPQGSVSCRGIDDPIEAPESCQASRRPAGLRRGPPAAYWRWLPVSSGRNRAAIRQRRGRPLAGVTRSIRPAAPPWNCPATRQRDPHGRSEARPVGAAERHAQQGRRAGFQRRTAMIGRMGDVGSSGDVR